jgi:hypothetical protein
MAKQGNTDTDLGMANILKEVENLKSMCVKVGVTEDVGAQTAASGATLAQIASWNELGVMGPPVSQNGGGKWFIPPRPFVRGFADSKREQIAKTMEKLSGLVSGGKLTAETAMARLGEYGQSGVKSFIRNGVFTANADSTIAKKGSSKPLIDGGTLRNSIRYQVISKPAGQVSES